MSKTTLDNKLYNSTIFLALSAFSVIFFPSYINPAIVAIPKILLVLTLLVSAFVYLRRGAISKVFVFLLLFWGIMVLSTIINKGALPSLLVPSLSSLQLCMTLENGFSFNRLKMLKVFAVVLGGVVLLNALSMFLCFNINESLRGMYVDNRGDHNYYLLGQDNGTIFYALPSILLVSLYGILTKKKIPVFSFLFTIIIGLSYLYVKSGNGTAACFLMLLFQFLTNLKIDFYLDKLKKISIIIVLALAACLSLTVFRVSSPIIEIGASVLGKDTTFTGRTAIWDRTIAHIKEKPMIGHGFETDEVRYSMIPLGKAHNMYLQICYNGGFAALFLFLLLIATSFKRGKNKNEYSREKSFLLYYVFSYLIICNFDFYIQHSLTFVPMIIAPLLFMDDSAKDNNGEETI